MMAPKPVWSVVCVLGQLCAEQYIKAFLEEQNVPFKLTHDLASLLDSAPEWLPELADRRQELAHLDTLGFASHQRGATADEPTAHDAMLLVDEVRDLMRQKLGIT